MAGVWRAALIVLFCCPLSGVCRLLGGPVDTGLLLGKVSAYFEAARQKHTFGSFSAADGAVCSGSSVRH
jgi:hypothetical protein